MAYRGDLIVCLVEFNKIDEESRVPIIFTLNGTLIHEVKMKYDAREKELYPFIGMCHKGMRVLAKVGAMFCEYFGVPTEMVIERVVSSILKCTKVLQVTIVTDIMVLEVPASVAFW